jgi:transmembrane sensor
MTAEQSRIDEASAWFARMRGPKAERARAEFEDWCSDPENLRAYREMAAIWTMAGVVRPADSTPAASLGDRRLLRLWPALVAASAAFALGVGFVVDRHATVAGSVPELAYSSSPDASREITLPDGTRVTLEPGGQLKAAFGEKERRVDLLAGRARFVVAHDRAHPFVVLAGVRAVVARGTVFVMHVDAGGIGVAFFEGAVDLEQRDPGKAPVHLGQLRPGQAATFVLGRPTPQIGPFRAEVSPSALLSGDGTRLSDIVAEANRRARKRIALADPALGELRVSGAYRPADPDALAATLAAALDLEVRIAGDGTIRLAATARTPAPVGHTCLAGTCP